MLHIEPIEEIVTTRKLIVTIDEDEIAKILVDPRPFQKMLRQQKSKWNSGRQSWAANGHATRKAAHPKDARPKAAKNREKSAA